MNKERQNYYGYLCTEMYEILHEKAPEDELKFYLSYAKKGERILEALCGSGRFLVPFMEQGYHISGIDLCIKILKKLKGMLTPNGKLVFAVETMANRCLDDDYKIVVTAKTKDDFQLILKSKNYYDEQSQTQFSPGIYELYNNEGELILSESMDFQTHLYKLGKMEYYLKEIGFNNVKTYSSFSKSIATDEKIEMFLYECSNVSL